MTKKKNKKTKDKEDDFFLDIDEIEEEPTDEDEDYEEPEEEEEDLDEDEDEEDDSTDIEIREEDDDVDVTDEDWIDEEGELTIDVHQDDENIYITAPLPGVDVEDIDINIDNDMVTIKAQREMSKEIDEDDYFYKENYWGSVSRSIILPVSIKEDEVDASMKNGVLKVILPKAGGKSGKKIEVKDEDE